MPEIAKQLGVAHILEGSVQKSGDAVRVNVQLIKAANDSHLWADTFDRKLTGHLLGRERGSHAIADQLQAKISPNEKAAIEKAPTTDLAAYDLYLRAQELFADTSDPIHAREKLPQAAQLLDEAVARDPHFYRLGVCCPEYMALPTLGATTTPLPVSVWLTRPCKPLCAFSRMRAKPTSPWPFITTTDSAITDGLAVSSLSPGAHCPTTLMYSDTPA